MSAEQLASAGFSAGDRAAGGQQRGQQRHSAASSALSELDGAQQRPLEQGQQLRGPRTSSDPGSWRLRDVPDFYEDDQQGRAGGLLAAAGARLGGTHTRARSSWHPCTPCAAAH